MSRSSTSPEQMKAQPPRILADTDRELLQRTANTIRGLAIDAVQQAESGHPGMPMGMADAAVVLWTQFLNYNPDDLKWTNRDRFVLSAGHGSMLLYSLLHLSGTQLSLDELRNFRQWGSRTPGHPENFQTPGVETTTGPLGQGFANAVGMALAERHLASRFNKPSFPLVDHYTYVIASDGDLMEGICHEASSLAGHLGLGKLIVLYDDNGISIDGSTDLTFTEDVPKRYEAMDWHTVEVDGHDPEEVCAAIKEAQDTPDQPSLIQCTTQIAYGSPNKAGSAASHGAPLGPEEVRLTKAAMDWPADTPFHVPDDVQEFMKVIGDRGQEMQDQWEELYDRYQENYPDLAERWEQQHANELPDGWDEEMPTFEPGQQMATRAASGSVISAVKPRMPSLFGGSADLTGSNKTKVDEEEIVSRSNYGARYIHFGVREHAMGGIMNGLALYEGIRPYGGTFLIFSDYMRPTIRLAALMELPVLFVFTHDSIGLGEDGPTHQPIEHLASLRAIPNLTIFRPADANEVREAWITALHMEKPAVLVLTRQKLPVLDREYYGSASGVRRGAYVLADAEDAEIILLATGSEVHIALAAHEILTEEGRPTRVVSMPSWEQFERQPKSYRDEVLPPSVKARVAIEAASTLGWERYVGDHGAVIGLNRFGASAPYQTIYKNLGLTPDAVADTARNLV